MSAYLLTRIQALAHDPLVDQRMHMYAVRRTHWTASDELAAIDRKQRFERRIDRHDDGIPRAHGRMPGDQQDEQFRHHEADEIGAAVAEKDGGGRIVPDGKAADRPDHGERNAHHQPVSDLMPDIADRAEDKDRHDRGEAIEAIDNVDG